MSSEIVVIKIGGKPASNDVVQRQLADELNTLRSEIRFVVVHGGGAEVSRISRALGHEPVFRDGVRMTTPAEMDIVDMVLAGKVNKEMVRRLRSRGVPAFGLSGADGGLITGEAIGDLSENRTGRVTKVDGAPLAALSEAGYLPVVSTVASDAGGNGLNINADDAALEIAVAIRAARLIYFSDIAGVLKDGAVIPALDESGAESEISAGTISGGMIPKVRASIGALKRGVREIVIGEYLGSGDLPAFISANRGTRIIQ